jgi:hypothetical protein
MHCFQDTLYFSKKGREYKEKGKEDYRKVNGKERIE